MNGLIPSFFKYFQLLCFMTCLRMRIQDAPVNNNPVSVQFLLTVTDRGRSEMGHSRGKGQMGVLLPRWEGKTVAGPAF